VTWVPTPPNRWPVDPDTGGQAVMVGWWNPTVDPAVVIEPEESSVTISPVPADGFPAAASSLPPPPQVASPAAPAVVAGLPYTASIRAVGAPVAAVLHGVRSDGSLSVPLGSVWYPAGDRRVVLSTVLPDGAAGVAVIYSGPPTYVTDTIGPDGEPYWVANALALDGSYLPVPTNLPASEPEPGVGSVTLSDPVLVQGTYDPGVTAPSTLDTALGTMVWNELPELYRTVDAQQTPAYPLRKYLQGALVGGDDVMAVAAQVYDGDMTDPVAVPDEWLGWLVAVMGVSTSANPVEARQAVAARQSAGRPGTVANLEAYVATMLTGSQYVVISPGAAWTLRVQIIEAEATAFGGASAVLSALLASGKLPAGHTAVIDTVRIEWAAVDARFGATWDPADAAVQNWADLDSTGL